MSSPGLTCPVCGRKGLRPDQTRRTLCRTCVRRLEGATGYAMPPGGGARPQGGGGRIVARLTAAVVARWLRNWDPVALQVLREALEALEGL